MHSGEFLFACMQKGSMSILCSIRSVVIFCKVFFKFSIGHRPMPEEEHGAMVLLDNILLAMKGHERFQLHVDKGP